MEMKDRIAFVIANKNVTKTAFAKEIKTSQAFVSQLCSGAANPSDRTIELICQAYGCNEAWLRTGEGDPFREISVAEEIMRFGARTAKGEDGFTKSLLLMLARMDKEDWANLEKLYDDFIEIYKKE